MAFRFLMLLVLGLGLAGASLAANLPPALSQVLPERNLTGVSQSFDLANFITDPDAPGPAVRITVRRGTLGTGTIDVALDVAHTPLTVANFLRYINAGHFAGSFIHRSVPGFIIQGGGFRVHDGTLQAVPTFTPVLNEPGVSNLRGTIAMAKIGTDANSATSQWFINLADNASNLDNQNGGFTAFGRVVGNGMAVADLVAGMPTFNFDPSNPNTPFTDLPLSTGSFTLATIVETSVAIIPTLTFTATSSNTGLLTVSLSGSMLQLTPLAGANGPVTVTVSATDLDGAQFTSSFAVNAVGPPAVPQPSGQAPTSIGGGTFHLVVLGGSGIFANSGSSLLLPATSGSTYVAIPEGDGEPSFGTFGYTKTATNTALISLLETNGSGTLSTVITGTFSTPSSGTFSITSPSSAGSSQTGSFVFSALSGQTSVQSPAAVGGLIFRLNITNGTTPFSSSGIGLLDLSATDNAFASLGIVSTVSGSSGSGTYSYTKTGATTGRINLVDEQLGALTLTASFTGTNSGTSQVTAGAFPGSKLSANFIAYALLSEPVAPGFALMPADKTVVAGQVATFSVSATGTGPLTHQWQVSTDGGATFGNLTNTNGAAGVTTATLSITTKAGAGDFGGNQYRCIVTNAAAAKPSQAATLTVNLAPKITASPVATLVNVRNSAIFTVAVTGTPSPLFQWQRATNGSATFSNLIESETFAGVSSATLLVIGTTAEMNGDRFRVLVGNGVGSIVTSSAAMLTVRTAPVISASPVSKTVTSGQTVVFAVTAAGLGPLTFAWQHAPAGSVVFSTLTNGAGITGATTATLSVASTSTAMSGDRFRAFVFNGAGAVTSDTAVLTVTKAAATLTLSGLTQTFSGGLKSATATTSPTLLTVSFSYNGSPEPPSAVGTYTVVATIVSSDRTGSKSGTLVITKAAQTITFAAFPAVPAVKVGDEPLTLTASASSGLPVSYASSNPAVATVTGSTLIIVGKGTATISATQAGDANRLAATAVTRTLTVLQAPAITTAPANKTVTAGQTAGFTVSASGTTPFTFQWQRAPAGSETFATLTNAAGITGATTATLLVATTSFAMNGDHFRAIVTNAAGTTSSSTATLTVNKAAATVTLSGLAQTFTGASRSATVTTTPAGLAVAVTYNGESTPPKNPGSYSVSATVTAPNHIGSASGTLVIAKAVATVTLSALTQTFSNAPKSATASTSPPGLTVNLTYNGNPEPPTNAGSYTVAATVSSETHTGSKSGTLVIAKAAQTIAFPALPSVQVGNAPLTLTATASSDLTVSYTSSNPAVAMVSGSTLIIVGKGTATITAKQAGDANRLAATNVTRTLTVTQASAKAAPVKLMSAAIPSLGNMFTATAAERLRDVGWNGDLYVAVGTAGLILTSPDGLDWKQRNSGTDADLLAVLWDGAAWMVVGSIPELGAGVGVDVSSGVTLVSPDGLNWFMRDAAAFDGTKALPENSPK